MEELHDDSSQADSCTIFAGPGRTAKKKLGEKVGSWVEVKGSGCPWTCVRQVEHGSGLLSERLLSAHWNILGQNNNTNHCNGFLFGICLPE